MSRQGVKLTPSGQENYSFWAFPSAMDKLKTGMEYLARGYDFTYAIAFEEKNRDII